MEEQFYQHLKKGNLVRAGDSILLAVSGGMDSMVMLNLFRQIRERMNLKLAVGHVDHGLRPESTEDAQFLKQYSDEASIPFLVSSVDVKSRIEETGESMEMAARYLRYKVLEIMRQEIGAELVATAHTASDQAETVLLRVLQGAGVHGLQGIRESRDRIIRPMLIFERKHIRKYAEKQQIAYREDSSNTDLSLTRNWIRHELLPQIREELNPNVTVALNRLAHINSELHHYLQNGAEKAFEEVITERSEHQIILDLSKCQTYFTAILKTLFINCLADLDAPVESLTFPQMEQLESLAIIQGSGTEMTLPGDITVIRDRDLLLFSLGEPWKEFSAEFQENGTLSKGGYRCESGVIADGNPGEVFMQDEWRAHFDAKQLEGLNPCWRSWEEGDWMQLSNNGRKKVSDIFIDTKTPLWEKHRLPLLAAENGEILWIPGKKRSARAWINDSTNKIVTITATKEL